jgi:hypothetical protein
METRFELHLKAHLTIENSPDTLEGMLNLGRFARYGLARKLGLLETQWDKDQYFDKTNLEQSRLVLSAKKLRHG